jgi:hypothetical protein
VWTWVTVVRGVRLQTLFWLAGTEGDDAPYRIVGRNTDRHAISGHDLDAKAAHAAAELGEDLVSGIALHAVQTSAMHGHNSTLHVNQIILAQIASNPFWSDNDCATGVN